MWLVLCLDSDPIGRWAYEELRRGRLKPVELVTDTDLAGAVWDHRLGRAGVRTIVSLPDGREIDSLEVDCVLNRLVALPPSLLSGIAPEDLDYAAAELSALLVSWLAGMGGRVLNPASTRGLSGPWRQRTEWAVLAAGAGLPAAAVSADPGLHGAAAAEPRSDAALDGWRDWPPFAPLAADVIVVGGVVFACEALTEETRRSCRRLAELAETPLLGLQFRRDGRTRLGELVAATPLPDLRAGGTPLIDALAEAMSDGREP